MARRSKLLSALDAHRGRDYKVEKQTKIRKHGEKRARDKQSAAILAAQEATDSDSDDAGPDDGVATSLEALAEEAAMQDLPESADEDEDEDEDEADEVEDGDEDEEEDEEEEDEEEAEDVPLSDLESLEDEEREDIVPHQRLTINNTSALMKAYNSIAVSRGSAFSVQQSVTSATQIEIEDVHDDLKRELAFYKQALDASVEARRLLIKEGVPFTRPTDYFAEMVKTDEHMGKIKSKMVSEAANKKAAADARRQRDLKRFGKQVQVAKQQERDKARKETLDKINILKRKRKGAEVENATEEDMFDVALDDGQRAEKGSRRDTNGGRSTKRQKKDAKFGFGGRKRFSKSGDAMSSGDMRGFSAKRMKGKSGAAKRPGKSRRAKMA